MKMKTEKPTVSKRKLLLFTAAFAAVQTSTAYGAEDKVTTLSLTPQPDEIATNEVVRRKEQELVAHQYVIEAQKAYREDEFAKAEELYSAALERLELVSEGEKIAEKKQRIQDALYSLKADWAEELAKDARNTLELRKFDEAVQRAEEARSMMPEKTEELDELITKINEKRREAELRELSSQPQTDPGKADRDFDIQVLLEKGKLLFKNNRLADARDYYEQILLKDPYQMEAIRGLRKIHEKLSEVSFEKRQTTVEELMAEVRWKWNEPVTPLLAGPATTGTGNEIRKSEDESGIRSKLDSIIIPSISFPQQTKVEDIVFNLRQRSRDLDPDGEGVNILLQLDPNVKGGATEPLADAYDTAFPENDGFGAEFGGGGFDTPEFGMPATAASTKYEPTIRLSLDNVSLGEAIRYICKMANLRYRIESTAVLIAHKDIPISEMETRFYSVEAGVLDAGKTRSNTGEFRAGDADNFFGDDDGNNDEGEGNPQLNLRQMFSNFGVDFPSGSRISYYPRTGKLIVHNTPENLRKLERVLKEINITPRQVTIEAKFVEVSQTDLEELGLEWTLAQAQGARDDSNLVSVGGGDSFLAIADEFGQPYGISDGVRFADATASIAKFTGILGDIEFNAILHALEQKSSSDVLNASKVTTLSGNTAILRAVLEQRYVTEWNEPEIDHSPDGGVTLTPPTPEFGDERDTGVILEVTPQVAADGYSIDLELNPQVIDFLGYDNSLNQVVPIGDGSGSTVTYNYSVAQFAARTVETKVIVWDGETVVLGGMIQERISKINDKVPFLGSIPYLGKLFQSNSEQSQKRNLLIFVTARLVDPAGLPIRANEVRGLPDFRR